MCLNERARTTLGGAMRPYALMAREIRCVQRRLAMHWFGTHLTAASEGQSQAAVARLAEGIGASRPPSCGLAPTDRRRR